MPSGGVAPMQAQDDEIEIEQPTIQGGAANVDVEKSTEILGEAANTDIEAREVQASNGAQIRKVGNNEFQVDINKPLQKVSSQKKSQTISSPNTGATPRAGTTKDTQKNSPNTIASKNEPVPEDSALPSNDESTNQTTEQQPESETSATPSAPVQATPAPQAPNTEEDSAENQEATPEQPAIGSNNTLPTDSSPPADNQQTGQQAQPSPLPQDAVGKEEPEEKTENEENDENPEQSKNNETDQAQEQQPTDQAPADDIREKNEGLFGKQSASANKRSRTNKPSEENETANQENTSGQDNEAAPATANDQFSPPSLTGNEAEEAGNSLAATKAEQQGAQNTDTDAAIPGDGSNNSQENTEQKTGTSGTQPPQVKKENEGQTQSSLYKKKLAESVLNGREKIANDNKTGDTEGAAEKIATEGLALGLRALMAVPVLGEIIAVLSKITWFLKKFVGDWAAGIFATSIIIYIIVICFPGINILVNFVPILPQLLILIFSAMVYYMFLEKYIKPLVNALSKVGSPTGGLAPESSKKTS